MRTLLCRGGPIADRADGTLHLDDAWSAALGFEL